MNFKAVAVAIGAPLIFSTASFGVNEDVIKSHPVLANFAAQSPGDMRNLTEIFQTSEQAAMFDKIVQRPALNQFVTNIFNISVLIKVFKTSEQLGLFDEIMQRPVLSKLVHSVGNIETLMKIISSRNALNRFDEIAKEGKQIETLFELMVVLERH